MLFVKRVVQFFFMEQIVKCMFVILFVYSKSHLQVLCEGRYVCSDEK